MVGGHFQRLGHRFRRDGKGKPMLRKGVGIWGRCGHICRGDVRRGLFFWSQKMHRSVTTKILLPDMFLRCDTKTSKITQFDGYRFLCDKTQKKEPRSTMALDRRWFFQVTTELQRMSIASIWYADSALFCLDNTVVFSCFFCISADCPSRFLAKCVAGLATNCTVKEFFWSRKGGFNWT